MHTFNKLFEGFDFSEDQDIDDQISYEAVSMSVDSAQQTLIEDLDIQKCLFAVSHIGRLEQFKVEVDPNDNTHVLACHKSISYVCIKQAELKLAQAGWTLSSGLMYGVKRFILSGMPASQFEYWNSTADNGTPFYKSKKTIDDAKAQAEEVEAILQDFSEAALKAVRSAAANDTLVRVGLSPDKGLYCVKINRRGSNADYGLKIGFTRKMYYILQDVYDKKAAQDQEEFRKAFKRKFAAFGKLLKKWRLYNDFRNRPSERTLDADGMPAWRLYVVGSYSYQWRNYYKSLQFTPVDLTGYDKDVYPDYMYLSPDGFLCVTMYDGTSKGTAAKQKTISDWFDKREAGMKMAEGMRHPWEWYRYGRGNYIIDIGLTDAGIDELGLRGK